MQRMPKKVLLIEDEPAISKFLSKRLTKMGCVTHCVSDGEEGLNLAKKLMPDLILLDLLLPNLQGEEICKAIREDDNPALNSIAIIMITAKNKEVDHIIGKVIGANAYITKPFQWDNLAQEIDRLL